MAEEGLCRVAEITTQSLKRNCRDCRDNWIGFEQYRNIIPAMDAMVMLANTEGSVSYTPGNNGILFGSLSK